MANNRINKTIKIYFLLLIWLNLVFQGEALSAHLRSHHHGYNFSDHGLLYNKDISRRFSDQNRREINIPLKKEQVSRTGIQEDCLVCRIFNAHSHPVVFSRQNSDFCAWFDSLETNFNCDTPNCDHFSFNRPRAPPLWPDYSV